MGIYVNCGNSGFTRVVNSRIYVDKTGLLEYTNEVLETEQCCICISRPEGFGKFVAADMLAAYYDKSCNSHSLFESCYISHTGDYEKNMNQYVVIYLDISAFIAQETAESVTSYLMKQVIEELQELYPAIKKKRHSSFSYTLAEINDRTGEKFVIIIDEWDAIFRTDRYNVETRKEYVDCLYGLFKSSFSKRFLALSYLTGIF